MSKARIFVVGFLLAAMVSSASRTEAHRILGVFPFSGKSHDVIFSALMTGLARRGHRVDLVTHFPPKNPPPGLRTLIDLNGTMEAKTNSLDINFITSVDVTPIIAQVNGIEVCKLMALDEFQMLIKNPPNDPPYDLVVTEAFVAPCYMALGHVLKVPLVAVTSGVEYPWISDFTGNHDNLALVPSYFVENFDSRRFLDRLLNVVLHYWERYKFRRLTENAMNRLMKRHLGPNAPSVREAERSVALVLVNRSPVIDGPKPVTHSMIEIGGLHLEENEPPKASPELQQWLDESRDGVVYFSFGSMVLIETLSPDVIGALYQSFVKIAPIRVLVKIFDESKLPPGLPANVKTLPWIPQRAVLAHENVRAFITHGGLMGSQEALYHGVPMIGVPLFSDQPQNVAKFVAMGMAVKIDYRNITESSLDEALNAILTNPKYRENAKHHSKLFKDKPMKAMDTAAFWIEYAIRNGNALRPANFELAWWQLALLDVYGFIFVCLASAIGLLYCAVTYLARKLLKFQVLTKLASIKRGLKAKTH